MGYLSRTTAVLALAPIMAGSLMAASQAAAQTGVNTTSLQHTVVLSDVDEPWDMSFLNDGTMFFTEKCDGLSVLMPSGEVNNLLGMENAEGYASSAGDLFCDGQAGRHDGRGG
ncbi:MAG: hypothetical protein ACSHXH_10390 [Marivita sp.]|uniref:hypothetical protein n=1 Tax=Marivita sp. TaxID=2003365 RepID=UPI003EF35B68